MKHVVLTIVCALLLGCACPLQAADRNLADALASTGAAHAAKGNLAAAKDVLYKALAYDASSPDAIFELAKIFEKEGNAVAAGDFYQRAAVIYSQEGKSASDPKRAEADRKVKALNPFAARLIVVYEDYTQEMDKVIKKSPDTLTHDTAVERIKELQLPSVLPADKLPLFYKDAMVVAGKEPVKKTSGSKKTGTSSSSSFSSTPVNNVPPDVERELKALGWDAVKGTWVKKGTNTYEVTDGRLEAKKIIGNVEVLVWKGYTGVVSVLMRDETTDMNNFSSSSSRLGFSSGFSSISGGYGLALGKDAKIYAPGWWSGWGGSTSSKYESYVYNSFPVVDGPKHKISVTANDPMWDMYLDEKKLLHYNDKNVPQKGQFILEVGGTATIEVPRALGR